jgi:hypothetical protein
MSSQAAAPAFMLGALAAFIAILISRLNRAALLGCQQQQTIISN